MINKIEPEVKVEVEQQNQLEIEHEKLICAFACRDINSFKIFSQYQNLSKCFINEHLKSFYQRCTVVYNEHKILVSKQFFIQRIKAKAELNKLTDIRLAEYEVFYDELIKMYESIEEEAKELTLKEAINSLIDNYKHNSIKDSFKNFTQHNDYEQLRQDVNKTCDLAKKITKTNEYINCADKTTFANFLDFDKIEVPYYTGIVELDEKLKGVKKGELLLILGKTGGGKSLTARFICRQANKLHNASVLYLHWEETSKDLYTKLVIAELFESKGLYIPKDTYDNRLLNNDQKQDLIETSELIEKEQLDNNKVFCIHKMDSEDGYAQIINVVDDYKADGITFDIVVIDHIGLVNVGEVEESKTDQMGRFANKMLDLAIQENFALIITQQVNRNNIKTNTKGETSYIIDQTIGDGSTKPWHLAHKVLIPNLGISQNSTQFNIAKNRSGMECSFKITDKRYAYIFTNEPVLDEVIDKAKEDRKEVDDSAYNKRQQAIKDKLAKAKKQKQTESEDDVPNLLANILI